MTSIGYKITVQRTVVTRSITYTYRPDRERAEDLAILNACQFYGGTPADWEIAEIEEIGVLDETFSTL
jgi:hypothetical protein